MRARFIGDGIAMGELLTYPGDLGVGAANYHFDLLIRCPICAGLHVVSIEPHGDGKPWDWDRSTLTLKPSVKVSGHRGVCHFTLTNGDFVVHADSTAKMGAA